jgi:serine/threonine protein kinase
MPELTRSIKTEITKARKIFRALKTAKPDLDLHQFKLKRTKAYKKQDISQKRGVKKEIIKLEDPHITLKTHPGWFDNKKNRLLAPDGTIYYITGRDSRFSITNSFELLKPENSDDLTIQRTTESLNRRKSDDEVSKVVRAEKFKLDTDDFSSNTVYAKKFRTFTDTAKAKRKELAFQEIANCKLMGWDETQQLERKTNMSTWFSHKNIQTETIYFDGRGDDLFNALLVDKNKLSNKEILDISIQCLKQLSILHTKDIVHKDLKLENIVLKRNEANRVSAEFIDFESMSTLENGVSKSRLQGTFFHAAPEIALEEIKKTDKTTYSAATDVYSLGIALSELLAVLAEKITAINIPFKRGGINYVVSNVVEEVLSNRYYILHGSWEYLPILKNSESAGDAELLRIHKEIHNHWNTIIAPEVKNKLAESNTLLAEIWEELNTTIQSMLSIEPEKRIKADEIQSVVEKLQAKIDAIYNTSESPAPAEPTTEQKIIQQINNAIEAYKEYHPKSYSFFAHHNSFGREQVEKLRQALAQAPKQNSIDTIKKELGIFFTQHLIKRGAANKNHSFIRFFMDNCDNDTLKQLGINLEIHDIDYMTEKGKKTAEEVMQTLAQFTKNLATQKIQTIAPTVIHSN